MLAATNAGVGNLDHFSSLQVVGLRVSEVKPRRLKITHMLFVDYLQSSTDVFKGLIILNHSLHSLPLHLMLTQKAFPKNSRRRYWI